MDFKFFMVTNSETRVSHSIALSYGINKKAFSPPDEIFLSDKQELLITLFNDIASQGKGLKLLYLIPHMITFAAVIDFIDLQKFSMQWLLGFFICTGVVYIYEFWIINIKVVKYLKPYYLNLSRRCSVK
jgi:hypothetical protein